MTNTKIRLAVFAAVASVLLSACLGPTHDLATPAPSAAELTPAR